MQQRLPALVERPIAFAHRGARAHAPENTLAAFSLALVLGATGLESDVWLTAEGIPVLDHDGVVRSGRRRRRIVESRREDLPAHIPELTDLLRECGTGYHLSLDLQHPEAGRAVVDLVRAVATDLLPRLWLCHPDIAVLEGLRGYDGDVRLVNSVRLARIKEGPERRAAALAAAGIDAVNMHHQDWSGGLATLFHRFERLAFGWDMQMEHQLRPALRMGLDGVFSDHVDTMVEAFKAELGAIPTEL
ncbi:MAG: glycerophosphodiester phosphodiesterase [Actinomycetota bacterium]|nr:glycerophosphodiester phosphodiesterase [Actinomycetota bacterium]